jgi:hypothetical protein
VPRRPSGATDYCAPRCSTRRHSVIAPASDSLNDDTPLGRGEQTSGQPGSLPNGSSLREAGNAAPACGGTGLLAVVDLGEQKPNGHEPGWLGHAG